MTVEMQTGPEDGTSSTAPPPSTPPPTNGDGLDGTEAGVPKMEADERRRGSDGAPVASGLPGERPISPPAQAESKQEESGKSEEEETMRRLRRPEDFEHSETRRSELADDLKRDGWRRAPKRKGSQSPAKRGRGRPPGSTNKKRRRRLMGLDEQVSAVAVNGRPERRCKTTTNTLVALSLAEERIDLNFESSSSSSNEDEDDRPLRMPRRKRRRSSQAKSQASSRTPKLGAAESLDHRSPQDSQELQDRTNAGAEEKEKEEAVEEGGRSDHPELPERSPGIPVPPEPQSSISTSQQQQEQEQLESRPAPAKRERGRPRLAEKQTTTPSKAPSLDDATPKLEEQLQQQPEEKSLKSDQAGQVSEPVESKTIKAGPFKKKKKKKRKKFLLSKKKQRTPLKKKVVKPGEQRVERRGRPRKNASSSESSPAKEGNSCAEKAKGVAQSKTKERPSVLSAPLEEILPDLSPRLGAERKGPNTKRAISEKERAAEIVEEVTTPDDVFVCLEEGCGHQFSHYSDLLAHRRDDCSNHSQVTNVFIAQFNADKKRKAWKSFRSRHPVCQPDYSAFVSSAIRSVPETTFNCMYGTLEHIGTRDAAKFRKAGGSKAASAVEKVRMNYSGSWTTEDVWETGGWELCRDPLSWHKYEPAWSDSRLFLQRVSTLHWSEQRKLKEVYDRSLQTRASSSKRKRLLSSSSAEAADESRREKKKQALPLWLGLRQMGRSIKYMTQAERTKAVRALKRTEEKHRRQREAREARVQGELNGEWEFGHDFTCTVCCATYDELREVLHHKWDAHPFCLVAHVTLGHSIRVPPGDYIHPQLGRQLPNVEHDFSSACTKCGLVVSEGGVAAFHAHILVCGGQEDWEEALVGKSKGRKKQKKSGAAKASRAPTSPEKAAEVRRARFARFEKPPPSVAETGRMTRLQANMIKEEKGGMKKKKKKKGWKGKKGKGKAVGESEAAATSKDALAKVRDEVEFEVIKWKSPVLRRPRRVMVNSTSRDPVDGGFHSAAASSRQPTAVTQLVDEMVEKEEEEEEDRSNDKEGAEPCNKLEDSDNPRRPPRRRASIAAIGTFEADRILASAAVTGRRRKSVGSGKASAALNSPSETSAKKENGARAIKERVSSKKSPQTSERTSSARVMNRKMSLDSNAPVASEGSKLLQQPTARRRKPSKRLSLDSWVTPDGTELSFNGDVLGEHQPTKRRKLSSPPPSNQDSASAELTSATPPAEPQPPPDEQQQEDKGSSLAKELPHKDSKLSEKSSGESESESDCSVRSQGSRGGRKRRPRSTASPEAGGGMDFPVEVKAYAVGQVAAGESQGRVARELRCSLATLTEWCQQKDTLMAQAEAAASGPSSSSSSSPPSPSPSHAQEVEKVVSKPSPQKKREEEKVVRYPVVPYERNTLLMKMRLRVEEVWKTREEVGKEAEESMNGHKCDDGDDLGAGRSNGGGGEADLDPLIPKVAELAEFTAHRKDQQQQQLPLVANGCNSGLALIANSYMDEDDEEDADGYSS